MKKFISVLVLCIVFFMLSSACLAADVLYRMLHADEVESFRKDQDAIIVGRLVDNKYEFFTVKVLKVVSGKMRGSEIKVLSDFQYGYGDTGMKPVVDDFCVMSLKKTSGFYKRAWGIFKADSGDYRTLRLVWGETEKGPCTADIACIEWYVNSGGTENDFSFHSGTAFVKRPNGEVVQVYPREKPEVESSITSEEEVAIEPEVQKSMTVAAGPNTSTTTVSVLVSLAAPIAALTAAVTAALGCLLIMRRLGLSGKRLILLILLAAAVAAAGGYFCGHYGEALWIKKMGIRAVPHETRVPDESIKVFLQNDPEWKDDFIGSSRFKFGGHGCLVSVLASAINHMGIETDVRELNGLFTEKGVYNPEGEVIWYKIGEAVPGVGYRYSRVFSGRTFQEDLNKGLLPVIMVRYHKTGVFHWVLIVGSDGEDFLIIDPLKQDKKPDRLGTHGKVYAYRVLVRE